MDDYSVFVEPIVKAFERFTEKLTNEDIAEYIDYISEDQKVALNVAAGALEQFCLQNTAEFCESWICASSCQTLQQLTREIDNFLRFPTPPAYLDVWNQLYNVVRKLNAWTTTLAGFRTEDHSYNTVVRGGVAYNVTSRSSLMSLEQYREAAVKALQLRHSFDEYLIVSDGAAASASSIFSSAVEQIWKNRDRSGADDAKVTTVSFGGTGDKADLTMAGVPASVEGVRLDNFLYTTISLLLFPLLLPVMEGNLKDDLLDVARSVDDRTYFPPYFAQQLPRISVQNYYDPFMDPGALPLQYIKMQPDRYIRKFFVGTTFNDDYDLASLYLEASAFFLQSTGNSTPPLPTSTPTQAPTIDPTSNPTAANVSGPTNPPSVSPSVTQQPSSGGASNNNSADSQPNKDDSGLVDPLCKEHVATTNFHNNGTLDPGEFVTLVNLIAEDQIAISFQDLPQAFQDMFDKWTSDTLDHMRSNIFRHQGGAFVGLQTICSETTALVDALLAGTIPSQLPTTSPPTLTPSTAPTTTSPEMLIEILAPIEETAVVVKSNVNQTLRLTTIGLLLDVCFVVVVLGFG